MSGRFPCAGDVTEPEEATPSCWYDDQPKGTSPYVLLLLFLMVCGVFYGWANEFHVFQEPGNSSAPGAVVVAFYLALLVFFLGSPIALFVYLIRRDGWPALIEEGWSQGSPLGFAILLFLLLPFGAGFVGMMGATIVANCLLDRSAETTRTLTIVSHSKYLSRSDLGRRSWLHVQESDGSLKWVPIPASKYEELSSQRAVRLTTKAGALGWEYYVAAEAAPGN